MDQKTFFVVSGGVFLLVALLHALRFFMGWGAMIFVWEVPLWLSAVVAVLAGFLGWSGLKLGTK